MKNEMKKFKKWELGEGTYLESRTEGAVVIGSGIAQRFELKVGDEVTIRRERFFIKGILKETGTKDDVAIFMPLVIAQKL
jgi:putative ABC transport system permease protein